MAKNLVSIELDNTEYSLRPYAVCSTAANTAAKAVTVAGFELFEGATICVNFSYPHTEKTTPTLNVNNTGAKPINGTMLTAAGVYEFIYDGSAWSTIKASDTRPSYDVDLTTLSVDNFYPVIFSASHFETDCEIHSPSEAGTVAYNQNMIHFLLTTRGYSDTPKSFKVLSYGLYTANEKTIGAIGYGNTTGEQCVWLRGSLKYQFYCNKKPILYAEGYANNSQEFTVGPDYFGGENVGVTIKWTADNPSSEVLSEAATSSILGGVKIGYTQNGKNYPVQLTTDNKAYVNIPWTDTDTKNTSGSTNNSSKLYLIGAIEQSANPQTYSNSNVYVTDGVLTATTFSGTATNADKLGDQLPSYYATAADYVKKSGDTMTGDLTIKRNSSDSPSIILQRAETNDTFEDWRMSNAGGYFKIQNRNSGNTWTDVLSLAPSTTKTLTSSYSVLPSANDTLTLGNSTYKWKEVYATTFNGNATSATTTTHLAGGAAGSIPYQTATGTTTMLTKGNNGQVLKISNGVPAWTNEYTYTHPDSDATANSYGPSANATPAHGGTFSVPYFTINAQGHVTAASTKTITLPTSTDTKNTTGATNSASKMYLIGATSQGENPQTYSNSNVYATNGDLVANSFQGSIKGVSSLNVNTAYKDLHFQFYNNVTGCDSTVSTDGKRYAGTANSYGFPVSNNANAMLWIGAHSGNYGHQLGFSSDGRIYNRYISNGSFPTTVNGGSWKKIAYTSDIITPEIATETEIKNADWW